MEDPKKPGRGLAPNGFCLWEGAALFSSPGVYAWGWGAAKTPLSAADAQALPGKRRARRQRGDELVELFHLAEDPYEKENLAARHPQKVQELRPRYEALARQAVPPKTRPKPPGFRSPEVWGESQ